MALAEVGRYEKRAGEIGAEIKMLEGRKAELEITIKKESEPFSERGLKELLDAVNDYVVGGAVDAVLDSDYKPAAVAVKRAEFPKPAGPKPAEKPKAAEPAKPGAGTGERRTDEARREWTPAQPASRTPARNFSRFPDVTKREEQRSKPPYVPRPQAAPDEAARKPEEGAGRGQEAGRTAVEKRGRSRQATYDNFKSRKIQEVLANLTADETDVYELTKAGAKSPSGVAEKLGIDPVSARLHLHTLHELGLVGLAGSGKDSMADTYRAKLPEDIATGSLRVPYERRFTRSRPPQDKAAQPTQPAQPGTKQGRPGLNASYDSEGYGESVLDDPNSELRNAYFRAADVGKRSMMLSIRTDRMLELTRYAVSKLDRRVDEDLQEENTLAIANLLTDCVSEISDAYDRKVDIAKSVDDYTTELSETFGMLGLKLDWTDYKPGKPTL